MSSNERDTHFKQFAEMLFEEFPWSFDICIESSEDGWEERWKQLIARRAYDLVVHTLSNTEHINLDRLTEEEHAARIPDMVEWPE